MAVTHGMNVGEVEALGRLLERKSDQLRGLVAHVDRLVSAASSGGEDTAGFLRMWPTHKARLIAASDRIGGLGRSAFENARAQVEASSSGSASSGGRPNFSSPNLAGLGLGIDAASYGLFLAGAGKLLARRVDAENLRGLVRAYERAPSLGAVGAAAFLVSTGSHGIDYIRALARGDLRGTLVGSGRLVLDGASACNPYAAAFNLGLGIGEVITDHTRVDETIVSNVWEATVIRRYGTVVLSGRQAHEMTARYAGWSGPVHYGQDAVQTAWENMTGLFR